MLSKIILFLKAAPAAFLILLLLNTIPSTRHESVAKKTDNGPRALPFISFMKIEGKLITKYCDVPCKNAVIETSDVFYGSGIALGKGKILTAGHLCDEFLQLSNEQLMFPDIFQTITIDNNVAESELSLQVYTNEGERYVTEILYFDMEKDLCMLNAPGLDVQGAEISTTNAYLGEKVYALSAPFGIFSPGMTLIFEGFYSGEDEEGNSFYTMPAKPGSSGSAILNGDGQIVGIIHSSVLDIESVSIGTSLPAIKQFIADHSKD